MVGPLQAAQKAANIAMRTAEAATVAAAPTPGGPAAKLAEETLKTGLAASMGSLFSAVGSITDIHVCPIPVPIPPHGPGVVIDACPTVLINFLPAARMGDKVLEALGGPDPIAMGCPTVMIGSSGGGGGGGGLGGLLGGVAGGLAAAVAELKQKAQETINDILGQEEYMPGIIIKGDKAFRDKTRKALDELKGTPTGGKLLDKMSASGKTTTIVKTTKGNEASAGDWTDASLGADGKPGKGSDATVSFNPDRDSIGSEPWEKRPPAIGLGHEMIHADHINEGSVDFTKVPNDSKPDPANPGAFQKAPAEEVNTAGIPPNDKGAFTENKLRSEWDPPQPQRPYY